jgi:hypothetical protein
MSENGLGYNFSDFITNASGHPAQSNRFFDNVGCNHGLTEIPDQFLASICG